MKTILLKMAGPMQAWGTNSNFESRQTDRYPSKSAVIGLIAASLGLGRNSDEELSKFNDLDFGVRIDQPGRLLRDYHTAAKVKANGAFDRTYVTNRYYIEDGVFVVALGHEDESFMNEIETALRMPYFQQFMGRRSLPLPADFLLKVSESSVLENLQTEPWHASEWYQKKHKPRLDIYCDADLIGSGPQIVRKDKVISFSQKERRHAFRMESHMEVLLVDPGSIHGHPEHDVFSVIGG